MLTITTCVSLVCDVCGGTGDDDRDPHFLTESEALAWAAEEKWSVLAEGRLSCRSCTGRRLCEAEGHVWGWTGWCECRPETTNHPEVARAPGGRCTRSWAYCDRCDHNEMRPGIPAVGWAVAS